MNGNVFIIVVKFLNFCVKGCWNLMYEFWSWYGVKIVFLWFYIYIKSGCEINKIKEMVEFICKL